MTESRSPDRLSAEELRAFAAERVDDGAPITKQEREQILGYDPDTGVAPH